MPIRGRALGVGTIFYSFYSFDPPQPVGIYRPAQEHTYLMSTSIPTDVLEQAQDVLRAWRETDPSVTLGSLTLDDLQKLYTNSVAGRDKVGALRKSVKDAMLSRDKMDEKLWIGIKAGRRGAESKWGDDSAEYELFGGTPLSKRRLGHRGGAKDQTTGSANGGANGGANGSA